MAEEKRKGLKRTMSRAASTFLMGKKGKNKSFFINNNKDEDEPYWMNDDANDDNDDNVEVEMVELNETPELTVHKENNSARSHVLKSSVSVADLAHSNIRSKPSFKTLNVSKEDSMASYKGKGKGRRNEYDNIDLDTKNIPKPNVHKKSVPYFIITVSLINIIFMIWAFVLSGGFDKPSQNPMLGPRIDVLVDLGGKWVPYILNNGEWWRLLTATYLHSGLVHILFNILVQYKVGVKLEKDNGTLRLMPIYILSGLSGNLLSALFSPNLVTVGASGAIYGFLGVLIVDLVKNWKKLDKPCRTYVVLFVGIIVSLAIGLLPGIDNFAHIGGFVMGVLSGIVFLPSMHFGRRSIKSRLCQVCIALPLMIGALVGMYIPLYHGLEGDEICNWCKYFSCLPLFDSCKRI